MNAAGAFHKSVETKCVSSALKEKIHTINKDHKVEVKLDYL